MRLFIATRLAAEESSVSAARQLVESELSRGRLGRCVIDDLVLAASELVTNAVAYGCGEDVDLVLREHAGVVELAVTNRGPADVGPVHSWAMPPPGSIGGRGLALVRSVADRVDTAADGDCFTVTVTRDIG